MSLVELPPNRLDHIIFTLKKNKWDQVCFMGLHEEYLKEFNRGKCQNTPC